MAGLRRVGQGCAGGARPGWFRVAAVWAGASARARVAGLLLAWLVLTPAAFAANILVVGPKGSPMSLPAAVAQARDGDTIELLPGEYTTHPLLLEGRRLTLRGVVQGDRRPVIQGGGKRGAAKALWWIKGGEITLEQLEFRGSRSDDGEGAGVRLEGGHLKIRRCAFYDNEYGVHAVNDEQATLDIQDSEFGLAPKVVGGLYHLLNVGRIALLQVSGSRFQQGFEGQLIKSRARDSRITYNFIHDGLRGGASYEIEFPAGGLATVLGNVIGQGQKTQNPVMVAYGTENRPWDRNSLTVVHNTMVNYGWFPAWGVRVIEQNLPPQTEVLVANNLLVGAVVLWPAVRGHLEGNRWAMRAVLRDADTYAFELEPTSWWRGSAVEPRALKGRDLTPRGEFEWPVGVTPIAPNPGRWAPGAYQR